jgi:exonuclease III
MDNLAFLKLLFCSWNVRGLGDPDKCNIVSDNVSNASVSVMCIQESKLASLDNAKARSLLPHSLSDHVEVDADGSRGGIVTA